MSDHAPAEWLPRGGLGTLGIVRVVLLFNPKSGSGRSADAAAAVAPRLADAGHEVSTVRIGPGCGEILAGELETAEALLLAGGDGTVFHTLPAAVDAGVPIYHVPCGNENLFAREFGMRAEPDAVAAAVGREQVRRMDLGRLVARPHDADHPFSLMVSAGLDASVIHRLVAVRAGAAGSLATGHLAYARPILAEIEAPHLPMLEIIADGRVMCRGERGLVIIANSRHYAMGLNPAAAADPGDGMLDVVFMPCRGRMDALAWAGRCLRGDQSDGPGWRHARAQRVRARALAERMLVQADGEAVGPATGMEEVDVTVQPGALRVLIS